MKALIILAGLLAAPAFADEGSIKNEAEVEKEATAVADRHRPGVVLVDWSKNSEGGDNNSGQSNSELNEVTSASAPATDHNSTRSNRSSSAQDYNSSRSNRTVGIRLDTDDDGDGLGVDDVARTCNGKDDDCNDQVRDAASGLATGKRQHGAVEEVENSARRESRNDRKTTRN